MFKWMNNKINDAIQSSRKKCVCGADVWDNYFYDDSSMTCVCIQCDRVYKFSYESDDDFFMDCYTLIWEEIVGDEKYIALQRLHSLRNHKKKPLLTLKQRHKIIEAAFIVFIVVAVSVYVIGGYIEYRDTPYQDIKRAQNKEEEIERRIR